MKQKIRTPTELGIQISKCQTAEDIACELGRAYRDCYLHMERLESLLVDISEHFFLGERVIRKIKTLLERR